MINFKLVILRFSCKFITQAFYSLGLELTISSPLREEIYINLYYSLSSFPDPLLANGRKIGSQDHPVQVVHDDALICLFENESTVKL